MGMIHGKFEGGAAGDKAVEIAVDEQGRLLLSPSESAPVHVAGGFVREEDSPHASGAQGVVMLALRADSDAPTAGDGDYTIPKLDEAGRLKVATQPASYPLVSGNIAAVNGQLALKVDRASNVMVSMATAALSGHNCVFEGSLNSTNGTDGSWFQIQAVRSNSNTIETSTGVLAAAPAYAWELSVNGLNWFRIRATSHTSGTAAWAIQRGTYATEPIPAAQVSASQPVSLALLPAIVGQGAEDAVVAGNAVRVGGRVRNATPTTFAAGDAADLTVTTSGALVEMPYAVPEVTWQVACAAGGLTTATATVLRAAGGAGIRNYLTRLDLVNAHASAATEVMVLDGAAVIFRTHLAPGACREVSFPVPLRGTAATALNIQASVASAIYYNASGYQAP